MKLVTTIIRPFKLDEVRDALTKIGVQGLTVTEVRGYGRQKGHTEIYRGAEYAERFLPKIKVEIACLSNQVDKVIETIISSAKTGKIGDGKIFVYGIDHAVRIRTGETDTDCDLNGASLLHLVTSGHKRTIAQIGMTAFGTGSVSIRYLRLFCASITATRQSGVICASENGQRWRLSSIPEPALAAQFPRYCYRRLRSRYQTPAV